MFVPTLALMALVLLGEVGLFNGVIPAAPIEAFFILAVLTLLLWLYLCGSDPGTGAGRAAEPQAVLLQQHGSTAELRGNYGGEQADGHVSVSDLRD